MFEQDLLFFGVCEVPYPVWGTSAIYTTGLYCNLTILLVACSLIGFQMVGTSFCIYDWLCISWAWVLMDCFWLCLMDQPKWYVTHWKYQYSWLYITVQEVDDCLCIYVTYLYIWDTVWWQSESRFTVIWIYTRYQKTLLTL